jgi:hypothetical protein
VRIGRSKLRSILESAHGVEPNDQSDAAKEKRRVTDYLDFDGLEFWARLGIKTGENGYRDRNVINYVVTPNFPDWPRDAKTKQAIVPARNFVDDDPY